MRILAPEPQAGFCQVPHEVTTCPHLTDGQFRTWVAIASVCWQSKGSDSFRSWSDVAKAIGVPYAKFMDKQKSLKRAGGLTQDENGDWVLAIPSEARQETIQDEIEDQGKRKHTITQKEAWVLVKEGWNKHKPESWMRLDGGFNLPLYIAIETQAKRLNVERPDYAKFIGQVCRGATVDPWWGAQSMKASAVFGFSKVTDTKFENVEKLYKLGSKVEVKVDVNCDADIIGKYKDAGRDDLIRVVRLEAEDETAASRHVNSIPSKDYDDQAAYVYFAPGKERPVYWTGKHQRKFMYLF